jgi:hypothetical protein
MTDTTDIKALRDAAALIAHGYKQRWGCETNEDTGFVGIGTFDHDGELCPFIEVSVSNWSDDDGDDERLAEFLTLANPVAILALLDRLEAERQPADANEPVRCEGAPQHVHDMIDLQETIDELRAEIAALKGDQVPVALVDERQGCGGFCLTQHGRSLNIPHGTELFTAPQKPVLHPQLLSDIRQCVIDATAWCTHRTPPDYVSNVNAWLADGGVVKDGE